MLLIWFILLNTVYMIISFLTLVIFNLFRLDNTVLIKLKLNLENYYNSLFFNPKEVSVSTSNYKTLFKNYKTLNLLTNGGLSNSLVISSISKNFYNVELLPKTCIFITFSNNILPNALKLNLNFSSNLLKVQNLTTSIKTSANFSKYYFNYVGKNISSIINNLTNLKLPQVKYSPSNFIKYINFLNLNNYKILFIRKNKVFNKGRYSRNRQYYRTGVYWCLYVNIIAVIGIYFWFYKITMNFGYLWWGLYLFIASFILPKAIKYRLYNVFNLKETYYLNFIWLSLIIRNIYLGFVSCLLSLNKKSLLSFNQFSINPNSSFLSVVKTLNLLNLNSRFLNSFYISEYNYVDYYYKSSIGSKSIIFEKLKKVIFTPFH